MDQPRGFIPAEVPADEADRLRELASYGLLDTPPEAEFDRIARLAAKVANAPIALVCLVDARRQWFKAKVGLELAETPRDLAFCAHAILGDAPMSVGDALADPRFASNPLVAGPPHIRAYAGAPLVTPRGHRLGTVCVIDVVPRTFTAEELGLLRELADLVVDRMEPRRAMAGKGVVPAHVDSLLDGLPGTIFQCEIWGDARVRYTYVSEGISALAGATPEAVIADPELFLSRVPPDDRAAIDAEVAAAQREGRNNYIAYRVRAPRGLRWIESSARPVASRDGHTVWTGYLLDITERVAQHGVLEARERQLAAINRTLPGVVFQIRTTSDGARTLLYASERIAEFYGVDAEAAMADFGRVEERVEPVDLAVIDASLAEALGTGGPWTNEHRANAPSGQRWLRMLAVAEPAGDGATIWNGVLIDITEQKNTKELIGRERAQLRRLIDVLPDAVFIRDHEGRYLFANPAEGREHGLPASALVGRTLFELPLLSGRANDLLAEDRAIIDGAIEAPRTRQWTRPDGSVVTYRITKAPFEFEERPAVLGVVADITDQVAVEAARLEAEHRFRVLTEISPDVIVRLDLEGRVVYASPAIEQVLGYTLDEVVGRGADLVHDEDLAAFAAQFGDLLAGGIPAGVIIRIRNKGGAFVWMEVLGRLARDPVTDAALEVVIVARDVTERKSYELELEDSRMQLLMQSAELLALAESLKQSRDEAVAAREAAMLANSAKAQFLANMSHELRTPLNAVLGFSDFMLSGASGELSDRHRSYLADIKASGEHLLAMVNDMLDLARIDAGRLDLRLVRIAGRDLVEDCLAMLAPRAQAKRLDVRLLAGPDVPILADPTRLRQILINLVTNAVKFTPDGGRVTVSLAAEAGEAVFTIADTGRGMTAEDIRLALEPFRQVKSDTREQQEGAGLGLPITRALVELHGGRLEIDSVPGEGTSVRVRLPNPPS
jgi:PAS domain S-box-containing protein